MMTYMSLFIYLLYVCFDLQRSFFCGEEMYENLFWSGICGQNHQH